MYNNEMAYKMQDIPAQDVKMQEEPTPVTSSIMNKLKEIANRQDDLIINIDSKLHSFLNLRQGQKPSDNENMPQPDDFVSSINMEMERLQYNCTRLNNCLNHLAKII